MALDPDITEQSRLQMLAMGTYTALVEVTLVGNNIFSAVDNNAEQALTDPYCHCFTGGCK